MLEDFVLLFIMPFLGLALVVTFVRLLKGPTLPDRVVTLDLITTISIGMITAYAIGVGEPVLIDVAVVAALISFLGTIAFAYYVERRA